MKLKNDVISKVNPKDVYGLAGEEIKLYSDHGNVLIVTKENGEKISVKLSDVTEDHVEIKKDIITTPDAVVEHKIKRGPVSKTKAVSINQKTLF